MTCTLLSRFLYIYRRGSLSTDYDEPNPLHLRHWEWRTRTTSATSAAVVWNHFKLTRKVEEKPKEGNDQSQKPLWQESFGLVTRHSNYRRPFSNAKGPSSSQKSEGAFILMQIGLLDCNCSDLSPSPMSLTD